MPFRFPQKVLAGRRELMMGWDEMFGQLRLPKCLLCVRVLSTARGELSELDIGFCSGLDESYQANTFFISRVDLGWGRVQSDHLLESKGALLPVNPLPWPLDRVILKIVICALRKFISVYNSK